MDRPPLADPALVVLVGVSGAGKTTWAHANFGPYEVVSTDVLRALTGTGPTDMAASADAFAVLDLVLAARLRRRLTTVVDSTGLDPLRRAGWLAAAREAGVPAVAVVLDTDPAVCAERNAARERRVPARVLVEQFDAMDGIADRLAAEGWDRVVTVRSEPAGRPWPEH